MWCAAQCSLFMLKCLKTWKRNSRKCSFLHRGVDKRFKQEQKRVQEIERQMAEEDELDFSEEHLNRNVEEQMKNAPSIVKLRESYDKVMELIQDDG